MAKTNKVLKKIILLAVLLIFVGVFWLMRLNKPQGSENTENKDTEIKVSDSTDEKIPLEFGGTAKPVFRGSYKTIKIDTDKSSFSNFKIENDKVYIYCNLLIFNPDESETEAETALIGLFDKEAEEGLLKKAELDGYSIDLKNKVFKLKGGDNRIDVVFVGDYAGNSQKYDESLPKITLVPMNRGEIQQTLSFATYVPKFEEAVVYTINGDGVLGTASDKIKYVDDFYEYFSYLSESAEVKFELPTDMVRELRAAQTDIFGAVNLIQPAVEEPKYVYLTDAWGKWKGSYTFCDGPVKYIYDRLMYLNSTGFDDTLNGLKCEDGILSIAVHGIADGSTAIFRISEDGGLKYVNKKLGNEAEIKYGKALEISDSETAKEYSVDRDKLDEIAEGLISTDVDSVPRSYDIMQIYISDGGGNVYGPYPYGFGGTFELIEMLNEATLIEMRRGIAVIMPDSSIIGIDTKGHVECREEDETDNKFKVVREFDIEPEQYRRLIGVTAEIVRDRIFSKGDFYITLLYCGQIFGCGDCDSMREFFDILGMDYPV